jgi:putative ABC transport system permease protein
MLQDLRFALRMIKGHPWFALAIISTIALGIGINTTVFTLVNAVLFRNPPFPDSDRLFVLSHVNQARNGQNRLGLGYQDYLDYREQAKSLEALEGFSNANGILAEPSVPPDRYRMARVTLGLLATSRTPPALGRMFNEDDMRAEAPAAVIISDRVWRNRYQASTEVIGRHVRLNGRDATIVGVMPPDYGYPVREDIWTPLVPTATERDDRTYRFLTVVGVRASDVTPAGVLSELSAIATRLEANHPTTNAGQTVKVETFVERWNGGEIRLLFLLSIGAVGLVLLAACANVANMLLGRALARNREMSVRTALGASRWQLIRQLLVESVVLSVTGGLVGFLLSYVGVQWFESAVRDSGKPSWVTFTMDFTVYGYFAAVSVLSGIIFGLAPAMRSSRADLTVSMKQGGRGGSARGSRLVGPLVVAQVTVAVVLLSGAGLMVRSFLAKQATNASMNKASILAGRIELPSDRYGSKESRIRFFESAVEHMAAIPGATAAAAMPALPGFGGVFRRVEIEGHPVERADDRPSLPVVPTTPGFVPMMNLSIVHGRNFEAGEGRPGHEVAVVTRQFASRFWPDGSAVGRRLRFNGETAGPWMTVVGIVTDFQQVPDRPGPGEVVLTPFTQEDPTSMLLVIRTTGHAELLSQAMRQATQSLDQDLALGDLRTFETSASREGMGYAVFGALFGVFAAAALLMAAVGLYGVMSQATGRRTREIGIRMALGATPRRVLTNVMRAGVWQLAIGLSLGLGAGFGATQLLQSILYGVNPGDPLVFGLIAGTMAVTGLLACWLPARHASRIAPVRALGAGEN